MNVTFLKYIVSVLTELCNRPSPLNLGFEHFHHPLKETLHPSLSLLIPLPAAPAPQAWAAARALSVSLGLPALDIPVS